MIPEGNPPEGGLIDGRVPGDDGPEVAKTENTKQAPDARAPRDISEAEIDTGLLKAVDLEHREAARKAADDQAAEKAA